MANENTYFYSAIRELLTRVTLPEMYCTRPSEQPLWRLCLTPLFSRKSFSLAFLKLDPMIPQRKSLKDLDLEI